MQPIRVEGSLTERVADQLRQAILDGEFEPGSIYSVHAIAQELGVSRTPVREALIRLAAQGMVRFERNRGFVVLRSSSQDLQEIFCLRLLLEVPAARAAALRATPAAVAQLEAEAEQMKAATEDDDAAALLVADRGFHRALLTLGGNSRLAEFVDGLRDVVLTRGVSTANRSRPARDVLAPHLELLDHVRRRDAAAAARTMYEHVATTARLLLAQEFGADAVAELDRRIAEMVPDLP